MNFPQYLWRIGTGKRTWMLRRGNDSNEPIEKFLRKDHRWLKPEAKALLPVGVLDYCEIGDDAFYSENHPWDWLNE